MTPILVIILLFVIVGAISIGAILDRAAQKKRAALSEEARKILEQKEKEEIALAESQCCGMGEECEQHAYLFQTDPNAEYYDDEELDKYAHHDPQTYTDEEIEEFREVLYTMKAEDVINWLHSLKLRNIEIPLCLRDEAALIANGQ